MKNVFGRSIWKKGFKKKHISCICCQPMCFISVELCEGNSDMNPSKLTRLFYLFVTLCQDGRQVEVFCPETELKK